MALRLAALVLVLGACAARHPAPAPTAPPTQSFQQVLSAAVHAPVSVQYDPATRTATVRWVIRKDADADLRVLVAKVWEQHPSAKATFTGTRKGKQVVHVEFDKVPRRLSPQHERPTPTPRVR